MKIDMLIKKICLAAIGAGSGLVIAACYGAHMSLERETSMAERRPQPSYGEQSDCGGSEPMQRAGVGRREICDGECEEDQVLEIQEEIERMNWEDGLEDEKSGRNSI